MGEVFIVRRGGSGGISLNFRVIGSLTEPSSPKENDLWVKTDVAIGKNWQFRPETNPGWGEPEGTVFIKADIVTSGVFFNLLKGQYPCIYTGFSGCIQYSAGKWTKKDAYIRRDSNWTKFSSAWDGVLYNAGTFTDRYTHSQKMSGCNITTNQSDITLKSSANAVAQGYVYFEDVDTSEFSTLTATFRMTSSNKDGATLLLANSSDASYASKDFVAFARYSGATTDATLSIDLTGIPAGQYCVLIGFDTDGSKWTNARTMVLSELSFT